MDCKNALPHFAQTGDGCQTSSQTVNDMPWMKKMQTFSLSMVGLLPSSYGKGG
jgi:hypothetical protein